MSSAIKIDDANTDGDRMDNLASGTEYKGPLVAAISVSQHVHPRYI
jgi:hypothetical protein